MTEPLLIQQLTTQVNYLSERQSLLAKNVANIDTPGYRAEDLKKVDFSQMVSTSAGSALPMKTTSGKHIEPSQRGSSGSFAKQFVKTETRPNGNSVVLEDQMGKVADVTAQNQMATALLRKFHQLYRAALDNKAS